MTDRLQAPPSESPHERAIAYHEAGHVVVGTRLGLRVLDVDIDRDDDGGRGHTHFAPPGPWFRPAPGSLSNRERDLVERVVTTFMAGVAAEERIGADDPEGSGYDFDRTMREWLSHLEPDPTLRPALAKEHLRRAREQLDKPGAWRAVEAIAEALLARRRLAGEGAVRLIGGA